MCGRYGLESKHSKQIENDFNMSFVFDTETNICPSTSLPFIVKTNHGLQQYDGFWGIQPSWSKKLIINAQSETAEFKPTFKHSFLNYRCIIPMSYWFEWSKVDDEKVKHQFSHIDNKPLYMAGIFYPREDSKIDVVSLTTTPTNQCKRYHHRMPLIINDRIKQWMDNAEICSNLTTNFKITNENINVQKQNNLFDFT